VVRLRAIKRVPRPASRRKTDTAAGGALGFAKLQQRRYDTRTTVCAIGVRQTMAERDPSSLTSLPVILHYGATALSAAITLAISSYPKLKIERLLR
jgi:hypothetical protein